MADREKILAGRKAVDAYRTAHTKLYEKGWHKGISEEHTSLLNKMLAELKEQGFNSLDEFFTTSEESNCQGLGFASRGEFGGRITELNKEAERIKVIAPDGKEVEIIKEYTPEAKELSNKLREMWH